MAEKKPQYYTLEQLGPNRSLTPEGFLICRDVPIARVGEMVYGPGETPVAPGPDGMVHIERSEADVFAPDSVASIVGKSVVDDHPEEDVGPDNWRELSLGHVMNPRRGDGECADCLVADLFITDRDAIRDIDAGKREVSCGYTPDYFQTAPGRGRQTNIIYNHLALVERGRCGPRCSIGDRATQEAPMARTIKDRLLAAFKAKDEDAISAIAEEAERRGARDEDMPGVHLHLGEGGGSGTRSGGQGDDETPPWFKKFHDGLEPRLSALEAHMKGGPGAKENEDAEGIEAAEAEKLEKIEGQLEEEAPPGTGDRARKAKDSEFLQESFQETAAGAEILAPGIRIPAYDRAARPTATFDAICALRKSALELANGQADTRGMIEQVLGRPLDPRRLTCDAARAVFRSVVAMKASSNNRETRDGAGPAPRGTPVVSGIRSLADLNKAQSEFWAKQNARSA